MVMQAVSTFRKYARKLPLDLTTPCWLWPGGLSELGYGRIMLDGERNKYVHRLSYQLHVGPIPRGWEIDHVCHSVAAQAGTCTEEVCEHRACWNPAHLEAVTSRENSMRGNHPLFSVARKTVCQRGHDLTNPKNVYVRPDGRRRCHVCSIMTQQERRVASSKR